MKKLTIDGNFSDTFLVDHGFFYYAINCIISFVPKNIFRVTLHFKTGDISFIINCVSARCVNRVSDLLERQPVQSCQDSVFLDTGTLIQKIMLN